MKADLIASLLATNPEPVESLPLPDEETILNIIDKLEGVNLAQRTQSVSLTDEQMLYVGLGLSRLGMQMLKPTILATYPSNLRFAVNRERTSKKPFMATMAEHNLPSLH